MTDCEREEELRQVARAVAAEVAHVAEDAARQVAATAAQAAKVLAETTHLELGYIKKDLEEIKLRLDCRFVSIEAFDPIRKLVYGMVGLILAGVVTAVLALIVK